MRSLILKRVVPFILLGVLAYAISYLVLRNNSVETWEKDGHDYLIFPEKPIIVYYLFRPLSIVDGKLTGMRFHIGPHAD